MSSTRHALVRVSDESDRRAYHAIRRASLWEERGLTGYDATRPEEAYPDHHALLLKCDGRAVATTRLDDRKDGTGIVRLVAVTAGERGQGHGRVLGERVDAYALALGIATLFVSAARDAEGFYLATGWAPCPAPGDGILGSDEHFLTMRKTIRA